jgi:hypothetical protein
MKDRLQKYQQRIIELEKENLFLREKLSLQDKHSKKEKQEKRNIKPGSKNISTRKSFSDKIVQPEITELKVQAERHANLPRKNYEKDD